MATLRPTLRTLLSFIAPRALGLAIPQP
jgi:hypothetical protein